MIQLRAPSSGETWEFIRRATLTVHYGDSLAVKCTSVVHSFLRCIVGLNKWLSPQIVHYLLFEGIGGDFEYSH